MSNNFSAEERIKIYELCNKQLAGRWADVSENQIIIKKISKGLMNQIIHCQLPQIINNNNNKECDSVVIRYSTDHYYNNDFNTHLIAMISLILSEKEITPKVFRIFNGGIISQFIKNRAFNDLDDRNSQLVDLLAQKLAKFHSIKMPLIQNGTKNWLHFVVDNWFSAQIQNSLTDGLLIEAIRTQNRTTFLSLNFGEELNWIRKTVESFGSPIVFSHCDFNKGNILVHNYNTNYDLDLFLLDFDFSCNTCRGFDFGRYFSSYGQKEPIFGSEEFPKDFEMFCFIDSYIKANVRLFGNSYTKQAVNSREFMIKEAKVFALFGFLVDVVYCLYMAERESTQIEEYLERAETRFRCYSVLKTRIFKEYPNEYN